MGMNPRLLRPIANNIDPDAAVYLNAVAQADGQSLEPGVRKAINDFVVGCKADGIWDAIKACCILMGARTLNGILTPLKGAAPTGNAFVGDSTDYNRKTGLLGNGSTKFINTNRNNNADPQNNFHLSVYVSEISTINNGSYIADRFEVGCSLIYSPSPPNNLGITLRSNGGFTFAPSPTGFIGASRASSTQRVSRFGGTSATANVNSQSITQRSLHVFCDDGETNKSNGRIAFYSIGESIDLALLDSRVSNLHTAIGAAI